MTAAFDATYADIKRGLEAVTDGNALVDFDHEAAAELLAAEFEELEESLLIAAQVYILLPYISVNKAFLRRQACPPRTRSASP